MIRAEPSQLLKEQQAASVMQHRMLPATRQQFANVTLSYELYGASHLCGDFVDFVELPDARVVFLVADVAGHGVSAALVTVVLKSFMSRVTAASSSSPAALLNDLNTELLGVNLDRHVSALAGVLQHDAQDVNAHRLTLASAGAFPLPLYWSAEQSCTTSADSLELAGKALGLFDSPACVDSEVSFKPGDRLTVVTDGVLELLPKTPEADAWLANAAAVPADQFWHHLGVEPAAGGVDDATRFTLEAHG